jgi:hypothetical protein
MNTDIKFNYNGVNYTVDKSAEQVNYIQLPDGHILHVDGWLETWPPYPRALSEVVPNNMVKTVLAVVAKGQE